MLRSVYCSLVKLVSADFSGVGVKSGRGINDLKWERDETFAGNTVTNSLCVFPSGFDDNLQLKFIPRFTWKIH